MEDMVKYLSVSRLAVLLVVEKLPGIVNAFSETVNLIHVEVFWVVTPCSVVAWCVKLY
jgi:hypothetical protein